MIRFRRKKYIQIIKDEDSPVLDMQPEQIIVNTKHFEEYLSPTENQLFKLVVEKSNSRHAETTDVELIIKLAYVVESRLIAKETNEARNVDMEKELEDVKKGLRLPTHLKIMLWLTYFIVAIGILSIFTAIFAGESTIFALVADWSGVVMPIMVLIIMAVGREMANGFKNLSMTIRIVWWLFFVLNGFNAALSIFEIIERLG